MTQQTLTARDLAAAHALLSEPRLHLLGLLRNGPKTVTALAQEAGTSKTTISQNLQILFRGGAVDFEQKATCREYQLAPDLHPVIAASLALLEG